MGKKLRMKWRKLEIVGVEEPFDTTSAPDNQHPFMKVKLIKLKLLKLKIKFLCFRASVIM